MHKEEGSGAAESPAGLGAPLPFETPADPMTEPRRIEGPMPADLNSAAAPSTGAPRAPARRTATTNREDRTARPSTDGVVALLAIVGGAAAGFVYQHWDYYQLPMEARRRDARDDLLRSGGGAGLVFGVVAAGLVFTNLAYLARRSRFPGFRFGALKHWMTVHILSGVLALLLTLLHSSFHYRANTGTAAVLSMAVLVTTGLVGRFIHARIPRSDSGRELEMEEIGRLPGTTPREWNYYKKLKTILSAWRVLHRWFALGMLIILGWHVYPALRFAIL